MDINLLDRPYLTILLWRCTHITSAPADGREPAKALEKRQCKLYDLRLDADIEMVTEKAVTAWPSPTAPTVSLASSAYDKATLNAGL